jgi:lipopolysaccharide/colanic/teichoic acid biosynthesis glycosyltransferase
VVSGAAFSLKRSFDILFAAFGLLVLSPLLLLLALAVKLSGRGPVLYRQQRVGRGGRPFCIVKFRSMVDHAEDLGLGVTRDGDPRITATGRYLRKTKLDELPQLWNVLVGDMSFVGPRPEVHRYVEKYTAEQRHVLALKPGITDLATLEFRNEEELLRTAADTERFYLEYCVPRKIELNLAYASHANIATDILIILRTLFPFCDSKRRPENGRAADGEPASEPQSKI